MRSGQRLPARHGQNDPAIALSRKNGPFAGGDEGAENWGGLALLIETCKLNGVNPQAWSTDLLDTPRYRLAAETHR